MKKIVGVLVVLAVGVAALPLIIGQITKIQLRHVATGMEGPTGALQSGIFDYQGGYREATAIISFGLSDAHIEAAVAEAAAADERLTPKYQKEMAATLAHLIKVQVEIEHGPILRRFGTGFGLNAFRMTPFVYSGLSEFRKQTGVWDVIEVIGQIGLTGNGRFDVAVPAFDFSNEERRVRFGGLTGNAFWDNSEERMVGHINSEPLDFETADQSLKVIASGVTVDIDAQSIGPIVFPKNSSINIAKIEILTEQDPPMVVENLRHTSDSRFNDASGLLDMSSNFSLEKLTTGDTILSDVSATLDFNGTKPEVWKQYFVITGNLANDVAQISELQDLLYDILITSPTMNIGPIRFKLNEQAFDGSMTVSVDSSALRDKSNFDARDMSMWMGAITQTLDIEAAEGLVNSMIDTYNAQQITDSRPDDQPLSPQELARIAAEQRPAMLEEFVSLGVIVRSASGYTIDVDFNQGEMTVNGNPLPVEALLTP